MPTPIERRRAKYEADSALITKAATELRLHGEAGDHFAGLDADETEAAAALLEVIAGGSEEDVKTRDWEHARRVAASVFAPPRQLDPPGKPLPKGYENPYIES